jgi:bacillithiol biosynthesis deacetylase BshB1
MKCDTVVVSPHPDDAELFCGGTIRKSVKQGQAVVVLDLTEGERSSRGDLETRREESKKAGEVLGIRERVNLGLPDGGIGAHHLQVAVEALRKYRPNILLLPYWEERHPDHENASKLFTDAVFYSGVKKFLPEGEPYSVPTVLYYQFRYAFRPSFVVDITDVAAEKYQAVRCYASQLGLHPGDTPTTLLSSPLTLSSLEARDGFYGAMIGVRYGEPLLSKGVPGVQSLGEFAANHLSSPPLMYWSER